MVQNENNTLVVNAYTLFCKCYDALANSVINTCCMYLCKAQRAK